jgi:hypothetical protein
VILDPASNSVMLAKAEMEIDLGFKPIAQPGDASSSGEPTV